MSDNKKNQIIEDQRRANKQFIELKKMQKGELESEPKPSEIAIKPESLAEKFSNFWFHNKWTVIIAVFLTVVISFLVAQCATKTKYDYSVVYFSYTPVIDVQTQKVADYLENISNDLNGDGEVKVSVINCSLSNNSNNDQYRNVVLTKLQALIAGEKTAMLYITDEQSITYFNGFDENFNFFTDQPVKFGEDFYSSTAVEGTRLPEGLQISCRNVSDTFLESGEDTKKIQIEAIRILGELNK